MVGLVDGAKVGVALGSGGNSMPGSSIKLNFSWVAVASLVVGNDTRYSRYSAALLGNWTSMKLWLVSPLSYVPEITFSVSFVLMTFLVLRGSFQLTSFHSKSP